MEADDTKHWMGFNINAFARPSNDAEYSALLDEALMLLKQMNGQLKDVFSACEKAQEEETRKQFASIAPMPLSFWTHGLRPDTPDAPGVL